ncbi:macrophage mannose receptor 1-like [Cololabis saira]|uniref:macrophage mannose receptor 1-like n=1 Tax=Cololabis saira TaxID=129043 RepID=UPI002AD407B2|nr:macrophage mannose receptor 1-like [Cololabis saira]
MQASIALLFFYRMEKIIFRLLIITSSCSFSAKHVFIKDKLPWLEARDYCREHHVDLSSIGTHLEEKVFMESVDLNKTGWLGLYWDSETSKWRWSGGADYMYQDMLNGYLKKNYHLVWSPNGLLGLIDYSLRGFFCLNLAVVPEEKTWEEALDHCRGAGNDLASLLSESESVLVQTQIQHSGVSGPVWTGLRFLGDRWMWVNGDPLEYEAWTRTGDQEDQEDQEDRCPLWRRCGALTPEGTWEDRDCGEKLRFICG